MLTPDTTFASVYNLFFNIYDYDIIFLVSHQESTYACDGLYI